MLREKFDFVVDFDHQWPAARRGAPVRYALRSRESRDCRLRVGDQLLVALGGQVNFRCPRRVAVPYPPQPPLEAVDALRIAAASCEQW